MKRIACLRCKDGWTRQPVSWQPIYKLDSPVQLRVPFRHSKAEAGWVSYHLTIELERESDGRWIAEIPTLPGTMCYGATREDAIARVQALALRVLAERLEHAEAPPDALSITFQAA